MTGNSTTELLHNVAIGRASVLSVIATLVVVSNITCLFALRKTGIVNLETRVFLRSLAASDACVGILVVIPSIAPTAMGYWPFGEVACVLHPTMKVILYFTEQFSFLCVSIDRYISITKPLAYHRLMTVMRARVLVVLIWVISTGIAILVGFCANWQSSYMFLHGTCNFVIHHDFDPEAFTHADAIFDIILWCLLLPFPLILIIILNARIFRIAHRHARQVQTLQHLQHVQRQMSVRNSYLTRRNTSISIAVAANETSVDGLGNITASTYVDRRDTITELPSVDGRSPTNTIIEHPCVNRRDTLTEPTSTDRRDTITRHPKYRLQWKVTTTMLIITLLYVVSWTPTLVIEALHQFAGIEPSYASHFFQDTIFYSNSFQNTIIYFWRFRQFRKAVTR